MDGMTLGYINFLIGIICVGLLIIHKFKLKRIMANQEQFEAVLARIDNTTNVIADETVRIAEDIRQLKEDIANQGLPADVEANILASLEAKAVSLEAKAEALKQVGKDELPPDESPVEPVEPGTPA